MESDEGEQFLHGQGMKPLAVISVPGAASGPDPNREPDHGGSPMNVMMPTGRTRRAPII
jgi:hypothetical protein